MLGRSTVIMKCLTHKDSEAVAVCVHCGRALCDSCVTRSASGRIVCSQECAAGSKEIEDLIASTRYRSVRGARVVGYFAVSVGVIFCIAAAFLYFVDVWPPAAFVGGTGIAIGLVGVGMLRIKNRAAA